MAKKTSGFLSLAKSRKSTYEFTEQKVSKAHLKTILDAARWAPSCSNSQPWHFVAVQSQGTISKILQGVRLVNFPFVSSNPPLVIAFVALGKCLKEKHACASDGVINDAFLCVSMAVLQACLQATELGLGSCILTPDRKNVSKLLKIPSDDVPVLLLAIGREKPGAFKRARSRKRMGEIVSFERF